MVADTTTPAKPRRSRSPSYPGVDLKRSLTLAKTVFAQAKHHPVAPELVFQAWGLKSKSSQAQVNIAALKRFGLLETMPQRGPDGGRVRVSDLAMRILLDERQESADRTDSIRIAALKPDIHAELWKQYDGELPENAALKFYLQRDRKFTESGAEDFIAQFRSTIAFAGLQPGDEQSADDTDDGGTVEPDLGASMGTTRSRQSPTPPTVAKPSADWREVPIPIAGEEWPKLVARFPLTEDAWNQMLTVLEAMKPGLVEPRTGAQ